ncbi:hypothetical protein QE152_g32629 [Popillia japonica]|uniref:Uncharacterized protein n=1 Tax=Popillia japonica TaxID=7064 RepID=A0AAW1IYW3_POPJA
MSDVYNTTMEASKLVTRKFKKSIDERIQNGKEDLRNLPALNSEETQNKNPEEIDIGRRLIPETSNYHLLQRIHSYCWQKTMREYWTTRDQSKNLYFCKVVAKPTQTLSIGA